MRKSYNLLFSLLLVTITTNVAAQFPQINPHAPEIANALQFEEIPVSLYTGVPNIAIPLYSVQTLSKNIAIDLTYRYHPAGLSKYVGGNGWGLDREAFIARQINLNIDEAYFARGFVGKGTNLFQYSFLGNSGRFIIQRNASNQLIAEIIEIKSGSPYIKIDFQYHPTTFTIDSIIICDEEGHKYIFSIYDELYGLFNHSQLVHPLPSQYLGHLKYRPVYRLASVVDANQNPILSYDYYTELKPKNIPTIGIDYETKNKVKSINVHGKGKITFKSLGNSFDVINVHNDSIKKVVISPDSVVEKNFKDQQKLVHKLYYKPKLPNGYEKDMFGYPRGECKPKVSDMTTYDTDTDPENCTAGILTKIIYPGGGYSKFEFESNTYAIDTTGYSTTNSLNDITIYNDKWYNQKENIIYPSGIQVINSFLLNSNKDVYITISNPPIYYDTGFQDDNGPIIITESSVKLGQHILKENQAKDYWCFGKKINLNPGLHQLVIDPPNPELTMIVRELVPNQKIKKWIYGGGNRIKKISYYDAITKDTLGNDMPVKETNYEYNFFNNPLRSSGALTFNISDYTHIPDRVSSEMVGYKNVTVRETGKGRTEHTFISPLDFEVSHVYNFVSQHYFEYKRGLETKKTVYDSDNNKLFEATTLYQYHEQHDTIPNTGPYPTIVYERNGFVKKASTTNKEFFKLDNTWKSIDNTEITEIDYLRRLFRKTVEGGGDQFVTRYDYFENLNSCASRYDVSLVEQFKNSSIVSAQKTIYGTFPGSIYQMPLFMQSGKNLADVESKMEYLSYNQYRNPIEVRRVGGISTIYLWGYNYNIPFAVIENATYSSLSQTLINAARVATDGSNQTQIDTAIANLRADLESSQPNARITTFTYESLVGIKSITDPQGYTTKYEYDGFGRLIAVRDNDGNLVSENKYYFKP